MERVSKKLSFAGCLLLMQGHGGGIALIWKNEGVVQIVSEQL